MAYRGLRIDCRISTSRASAVENQAKFCVTLRVSGSKSLNPYCFIFSCLALALSSWQVIRDGFAHAGGSPARKLSLFVIRREETAPLLRGRRLLEAFRCVCVSGGRESFQSRPNCKGRSGSLTQMEESFSIQFPSGLLKSTPPSSAPPSTSPTLLAVPPRSSCC